MNREFYDEIVRKLVDDGKLMEAGFVALRYMAIPPDASATQVKEMRTAFFAGAQHLWASVVGILEPGVEPTDNDMRRLDLINMELDEWKQQIKAEARR